VLVLIVDNDPAHCHVLRTALETEGHTVIESYAALDAVRIMAEQGLALDVAIVDYYLGGTMTGKDVVAHSLRGVALFCMSAHALADIRLTWIDPIGGFLAFFPKPVQLISERPEEPGLIQWLRRIETSKEQTAS
jgi:CheY-like chemotaxis protein